MFLFATIIAGICYSYVIVGAFGSRMAKRGSAWYRFASGWGLRGLWIVVPSFLLAMICLATNMLRP